MFVTCSELVQYNTKVRACGHIEKTVCSQTLLGGEVMLGFAIPSS